MHSTEQLAFWQSKIGWQVGPAGFFMQSARQALSMGSPMGGFFPPVHASACVQHFMPMHMSQVALFVVRPESQIPVPLPPLHSIMQFVVRHMARAL